MQLLTKTGRNKTLFGKELVKAIYSKQVFALLQGVDSWTSGGCVALAKAVNQWSNGAGDLVAWHRHGNASVVDHICVKFSVCGHTIYIDGFGLYADADLPRVERLLSPIYSHSLRTITTNELEQLEEDTNIGVCWISDNHTNLTKALRREIGEFDMESIQLSIYDHLPDDSYNFCDDAPTL